VTHQQNSDHTVSAIMAGTTLGAMAGGPSGAFAGAIIGGLIGLEEDQQ